MDRFIRNKFIVGILFFIIGIILIQINTTRLEKNVPSVIEVRAQLTDKTNEGVKFSEFAAINDILYKNKVTAFSEVESDLSSEFIRYKKSVRVVLTDENFCCVNKKNFVAGGSFDNYSKTAGEKSAIISDTLSTQLFKSYDVLGNKIKLWGETYRIVGVYKTDDSFISKISEDGIERIIVPYTSYNKWTDLSITSMSVSSEEISKSDFNYYIKKVSGDKVNNYKSVDYKKDKEVTVELRSLVIFVIGLIIIIKLIMFLIKLIKKEYQKIILYKDKLYFTEILKKERKSIIISAIIAIIFVIGIVIVFNFISFDLVAPEGYIPEDNIFDITFYRDTYIKNIQLINSQNGLSLAYFDRYLVNAVLFQFATAILVFLSLISILISVFEKKLLNKNGTQ